MGAPRIVSLLTRDHAMWWPLLAPWIERAIARVPACDVGIDDVREQAADGRAWGWLVIDGARVIGGYATRVDTEKSGRRVVRLLAGAGERFGEWMDDALALMRRQAQMFGCSHLVAGGRRGWIRRLRSRGWHEAGSGFEAEV